MLIEYIIAKRAEKKALALEASRSMDRQAEKGSKMGGEYRDVRESGWVDEKREMRRSERGSGRREREREMVRRESELPSYGEVMKGM